MPTHLWRIHRTLFLRICFRLNTMPRRINFSLVLLNLRALPLHHAFNKPLTMSLCHPSTSLSHNRALHQLFGPIFRLSHHVPLRHQLRRISTLHHLIDDRLHLRRTSFKLMTTKNFHCLLPQALNALLPGFSPVFTISSRRALVSTRPLTWPRYLVSPLFKVSLNLTIPPKF